MKTLTAILLLISVCFCKVQAQTQHSNGKFTITGKVSGRDTGKLILWYMDKGQKFVKDTAWLRDGKFTFSGFISDPQYATLIGRAKSMMVNDPNLTNIFIEPADMKLALVENDFKHAVLTGSRSQAEMDTLENVEAAAVNRSLSALDKEYDIYLDKLDKGDTSKANKQKMEDIRKETLPYSEDKKRITYKFISKHPASYIGPYLLIYYIGRKVLPVDSAKQFYEAFTSQVKYSFYGKYFWEQINASAVIKPGIGTPAPGFTLIDVNNKPLSIADFKGKSYVLVDFWASWCGPCRQLSPYLKSLYEKFHAKGLNIISLSEDENSKSWKSAIEKDQTGMWHHALTHKANEVDKLPVKYGVTSIPSIYLVDKDGLLIGVYDNSDTQKLDQELAARLK